MINYEVSKMRVFKLIMNEWNWLGFVVWNGNWDKAFESCQRLDEHKKTHPVIYYITCFLPHCFYLMYRNVLVKILYIMYGLYV